MHAGEGVQSIIRTHAEMHRSLERVVTKKLMSSNLFIEAIKFHGYLYDDDDDKLKA